MFVVMIRVKEGELQPAGIDFNDECKYLPVFDEIRHAEAWIVDAEIPWTCIAKMGFAYPENAVVKYKEGEEPKRYTNGKSN